MKLDLDESDLRPIVREVVCEVLDQLQVDRQKLGDRLGFPEVEAAALLGIAPHILRDCRLRGELEGRRVGKKIIYTRDELLRFLGTDNGGRRSGRRAR